MLAKLFTKKRRKIEIKCLRIKPKPMLDSLKIQQALAIYDYTSLKKF